MSGLHPVLKQQYVPLYCKGTNFKKLQWFAAAFKQRCYMASGSAQQRSFEYVTSTEVNNTLRFENCTLYGLFNDAVRNPSYIASKCRMTEELEEISKEPVVI